MTPTNIIGAILNAKLVELGSDYNIEMASKNKGRMCVVAGCSKRQADGVSVHIFPKDQRQRAAWVRFVKLTRADWPGPSQYTVICSEHFNEDCYEARFSLMKDFGIPANKCLRKGSVPSIYPKRKRDELNDAFLQSPQLTTPPPERRAYAKRAKNMVIFFSVLRCCCFFNQTHSEVLFPQRCRFQLNNFINNVHV